ncbi:MAG: hypothetical protein WDZ93_03825 [Candidatus Paceibacterota bacterium]
MKKYRAALGTEFPYLLRFDAVFFQGDQITGLNESEAFLYRSTALWI